MDPILFTALGVAYVVLLAWGLKLTRAHGWWTPANLPLLVLLGLVYDNFLIAGGVLIGEGPLLESLNLGRFLVHATVTPVLVAWGLHTLRRAGYPWAQTRGYQVFSIACAVALMVLEYVTEIRGLRLEADYDHGALSYSSTGNDGPPVMVLVVAVVLLVVGALLWRRSDWPWLFVGTTVMTVGSAIPIPINSGAVTNVFELVLLLSVVSTTAHQTRQHAGPVLTRPT